MTPSPGARHGPFEIRTALSPQTTCGPTDDLIEPMRLPAVHTLIAARGDCALILVHAFMLEGHSARSLASGGQLPSAEGR